MTEFAANAWKINQKTSSVENKANKWFSDPTQYLRGTFQANIIINVRMLIKMDIDALVLQCSTKIKTKGGMIR